MSVGIIVGDVHSASIIGGNASTDTSIRGVLPLRGLLRTSAAALLRSMREMFGAVPHSRRITSKSLRALGGELRRAMRRG